MAGTRTVGSGFETTDGGLHLHDNLVKTAETSLVIGAAELTHTTLFTITASALTHTLVVVLPNWTNAVTCKATIANSDGEDIYESEDLVRNGTRVCNITGANERPIVGTNTITLTLSGVPGGAGGTAKVALYIKGGKS